MQAYHNWYHVTGSTFGTWLRGDSRGWRARHHREHVDGDYKNPPSPGRYRKVKLYSRSLMKRDRVVLTPLQRRAAVLLISQALLHHNVEIADFCVGAKHWHGLVRFSPVRERRTADRDPRKLIGIAKKHSARKMSDAGLVKPGGVWAVRCRPKPVGSKAHFHKVLKYIPDHAKKGAAVLSLIRRQSPGIPIPGLLKNVHPQLHPYVDAS